MEGSGMNRQYRSFFGKRLQVILLPAALVLLMGSLAYGAIQSVSLQARYKQMDVNTLEKGHEFLAVVEVEPEANNTERLYGASLDIFYDPEFLEVVDALPLTEKVNPKFTEGTLLNENATVQTLSLSGLVNDQPGFLTVGLARKGDVNGTDPTVGGPLVSIHFRTLAATEGVNSNSTRISFGLSGLRNPANQVVNVQQWSGDAFKILKLIVAQLDVNDDESIDLQDLILTLQVIAGQPPSGPVLPQADYSGDGHIGLAEATGIIQLLSTP